MAVTFDLPITCTYPDCRRLISLRTEVGDLLVDPQDGIGTKVGYGTCPACQGVLIVTLTGSTQDTFDGLDFRDGPEISVVFPHPLAKSISHPEIPEKIRRDFNEAAAVVGQSPKASAAISRRVLQQVLREQFKIQARDLATEIEAFVHRPGVPSELAGAIEAVRNVGNFAAHPLKNTNTGEIIDVETGEAEWLLEVLESLFDFAYVQPSRLAAKKAELNKKLKAAGKPEMK